MTVLKRLKIFMLLDMKIKLLLVEAFLLLGWARILKGISFSKVAPSLGEHMKETTFDMDEGNRKLIRNVSQAVNIMSRYTIWESMCLVKAIAAMKMLEKRKIESTIYFGTSKDENGKLIAHAWLRSGPLFITGAEVMDQFVVVSKFAKRMGN
ncbi:lasso peptide biosynthesis B2 protein [Neobacillus sp. MM2021_6]|uniref:lasso peptide biosynthesis B2 protein n=1 Tax=Bacillaceae TaxID=186817 RepID=UPI001408F036|nr:MULTISPECIES: lasso peptide biosynthesis B2 protein [Bacillaceae]MBO0958862.1 lasso peptide biosynthesis B2 protein [Neobacillus sp. MM2021_6]NHC17591.1 lasso peptide biosynthesis B2 protein [Bacillus sp. MM2020_4]